MDRLEKELYEQYGSSIISRGDISAILRKAAKDRLIKESDIIDLKPMNVSELMQEITEMRRKFMYTQAFDVSYEEISSEMESTPKLSKEPEIADKVLRAYFEYERATYPKPNRPYVQISILVVAILCFYLVYTPKPY